MIKNISLVIITAIIITIITIRKETKLKISRVNTQARIYREINERSVRVMADMEVVYNQQKATQKRMYN